MGEVYEARQFHPDRRVALKVLSPWLAADDEALARFWREAGVPAQFDHPGIVRIISTGRTDDGIAFYAMHLVRGVSLADMILRESSSPLPPTLPQGCTAADTPSEHAPPPDDRPRPPPAGGSEGRDPPLLEEYRRDPYAATARIGALAARA